MSRVSVVRTSAIAAGAAIVAVTIASILIVPSSRIAHVKTQSSVPRFRLSGLHAVDSQVSSHSAVVVWDFQHISNPGITALRVTWAPQNHSRHSNVEYWGSGATSWSQTNLTPSKDYVVKIQGLSANGALSKSYSVSFRTAAGNRLTGQPRMPTVDAAVSPGGSVRISWSSATRGVSQVEKYVMDIYQRGSNAYHVDDFVATLSHSYSLTLPRGTYECSVRLVQFSGVSTSPATVGFTVT